MNLSIRIRLWRDVHNTANYRYHGNEFKILDCVQINTSYFLNITITISLPI